MAAKRPYGADLYVMTSGDLCKIGRSMNAYRRLKELQHSNPWGDIQLVGIFPERGWLEPFVLRNLTGQHPTRGEWVHCTATQALTAVGTLTV
jgi:hypothetical protein